MEHNIFFTSDTHFGHDKDFIVQRRGFTAIEEMNEALVENWNRVVQPEDTVYHLGDVFMVDNVNADYVRQLHGRIHLIRGNHDSEGKIALLKTLPNIESVSMAEQFEYGKWHFFLCHYPALTCDTSLTPENINKGLRSRTMCLYGHTHQSKPFFYTDLPYIYNVGVDAHNCTPVSIEEIASDIRSQQEILQRKKGDLN